MKRPAMALRHILVLVCLLAGAALACNAPTREPETPGAQPTAPATGKPAEESDQSSPVAPETLPAAIDTATTTAGEEPLPTFTPLPAPTLKATLTRTNTPRPQPTSTARPARTATPTGTPGQDAGPLSFDVYVEWRLKDATGKVAIAAVTITARGGGGGYSYFRDELPLQGPKFEYEWATCSGNPISYRVTSADGQSVKKDLFFSPPCPTATPKP